MITKEETIAHFERNEDQGWVPLVEMIFDGKPDGVEIIEVWEKYAELRVYSKGYDKLFEELVEKIGFISQKTCQRCGRSGRKTVVDGWETILCDAHFEASEAKNKFADEWFYPQDKTITDQKLSGVVLFVADCDQAAAFYIEKIGFFWGWDKTTHYTKQGVVVAPLDEMNTLNLILVKAETPEESALIGKQTTERSAFILYTSNFDLYFERLVEHGVPIIRQPVVQEWGKEALIADLYGNVFRVIAQEYE